MRFNCQVEVTDRSSHKSGGKLNTTLSLGGFGPSKIGSNLWILLQTSQNKTGTRYKINGNIEAVFTKFINEGKFTVRLYQPEIDIIVLTEPKIAKKFICLLRQVLDYSSASPRNYKYLTNLETAPDKYDPPPPKKLTICNSEQLGRLKGYPSSLEELEITNAGMDKIAPKIFRLEHLKILRLNSNLISFIPKSIELCLNLTELRLADNKLGRICKAEQDWDWLTCRSLCESLAVLDLSDNELPLLPNCLPRLKALHTLVISCNSLLQLPNNLGFIPNLKYLMANGNNFSYIPVTLISTELSHLDVSDNLIEAVCDTSQSAHVVIRPEISLKDAAARVVLDRGLEYDERTLPRDVMRYVESACYCHCGASTFPSTVSHFQATKISRLAKNYDYDGCPYLLLGYRKCPKKQCRL